MIRASKWSALAEISTKGINPLLFIILAKILQPDDFGIFAIAAMIINFSQIFWDAGLSKALIQQKSIEVREAESTVFWTNLTLGCILYLFIFATSGIFADLFNEPKVKEVIKVQGALIILSALPSSHIAILQRNLDFKKVFYIRLLTIIPNFLSIPLAFAGFGYWSLVYGSLIGSALQVIVLWMTSSWKPELRYDSKIVVRLFKFGIWVTGEGFLAWLYLWADSFFIGFYLGTRDLGIYRTGHFFVLFVYGVLFSPIMPVLFSTFSRLQSDRSLLADVLKKILKLFALISLPAGLTLFILHDSVALSFFNDNWTGIGTVIGWLGLMYGLSWTIASYSEAYKAIGRPDINTKIMFIGILYYIPCYAVAASHSVFAFLVTRFFLTCVTIFIHQYFAKKYLSISFTTAISQIFWIVLASCSMALIIYTMIKSNIMQSNVYASLAFYGSLSLGLYSLFLVKEWSFIKYILEVYFEKNYSRNT